MVTTGHEEIFKGDENALDQRDIKTPQAESFNMCNILYVNYTSIRLFF